MGENNDKEKNEVGYGKPPKHSQFKPGQSGNPNGRPKGSVSVASIVAKVGDQIMSVVENGEKKDMAKMEVMILALFAAASKGNVAAAKLLTSLKQQGELTDITQIENPFGEIDAEIFQSEIAKLAEHLNMEKEMNDGSV